MKQAKKILNILSNDVWFHIFSFVSVFLIVTSFFIPPKGIIDSSVFAGVGELFLFAALWEAHVAIKRGMDAKITKNDITLEINNPDTDKNHK